MIPAATIFSRRFFIFVMAIVLGISFSVYAQKLPATHQQTKPLKDLLNRDGTLNLKTGFHGSVDVKGWKMVTDKKGHPHFVRTNSSIKKPFPKAPADQTADNIYWESRFQASILDAPIRAVAVVGSDVYFGGEFTTIGDSAVNYIAKWSGGAWSALAGGVDGPVFAITVSGSDIYVGGNFLNAGGIAASNIAKWNDSVWSPLDSGVNDQVNAIAINGSDVYVGGNFTTAGGSPASYIAKWSGGIWSAIGSGFDAPVSAIAISGSTVYAGGSFVNAGDSTVNYIAQWNGSVWKSLNQGLDAQVFAIKVSGISVYVGGAFTTASGTIEVDNIGKWNGTKWSAMGPGFDGPVNSIVISGTNIFAGGEFGTAGDSTTQGVARWTGSKWASLDLGVDGTVNALAANGSLLYVGGDFGDIGSLGAPAVDAALWDGTRWSALSNDLDMPPVSAIAVSGSTVYVGGAFLTAGGTPANYVAKWNGKKWSSLGAGLDGPVTAIAVSGKNVYVGGSFGMAGTAVASNIALWNGSKWSAMGNGLDGAVNAIVVSGKNVYVGGAFATAGTASANNVAVWGGSSWSALGDGTGDQVNALAMIGSTLYAGGFFMTAGDSSAHYSAKWDGSKWLRLGQGTDGVVDAFAVIGTTLFVGGEFVNAGGSPANYLAQWNGSSWSAVGSGTDDAVNALASFGGRLYLGGNFIMAGDQTANGIAKWNGFRFLPLGSGVDAPVHALAVSNDTVYIGGDFALAGLKASAFWGIWHKPFTLPEFSAFPSVRSFDSVRVGSTKTDSILVYNTGGGTLSISLISVSDAEFHITPSTASISGAGSQTFTVQFTPDSVGEHDASLIFTHDASSSPDGLSLTGVGIAPHFSIDQTNIDYGTENPGAPDADTVTVTNDGTATLNISSVISDNGAFTVSPTVAHIVPGGSADFHIVFVAPCTELYIGNIIFVHDANSSPDSVRVTALTVATGSISGSVFKDINANAVQDSGEPELKNWRIRISAIPSPSGTGCTSHVDSLATDSLGNYTFDDLADGRYHVTEMDSLGLWVTYPPAGDYTLDIVGGNSISDMDFGNTPTLILYSGTITGVTESTVVEIRGSVSASEDDTVLALHVARGGSLGFGALTDRHMSTPGSTQRMLAVHGPIRIDGSLDLSATQSTLLCFGDWINHGTFVGGNSTVVLEGDRPAVIDATSFANLVVDGLHKRTADNLRVLDTLVLHHDLYARLQDTVFIDNPVPGAIADTGIITGGSVHRLIAPHETGIYRFESPGSFVQFDGIDNPPSFTITTIPDTVPRSFNLGWIRLGGKLDTTNHTVTLDSLKHLSTFVFGTRGSGLVLHKMAGLDSLGTPTVRRLYRIKQEGGTNFHAKLQLRYDPLEVMGTLTDLELLRGPVAGNPVNNGWNMVSLPVTPEILLKDSVFKGSSSPAFSYNGGYQMESVLQVGTGYWLKFPSATSIQILGEDRSGDSVDVVGGWNMVGTPTYPVQVVSVKSIPPGIVTSYFYGYRKGYFPADSLLPMQGYWVKMKSSGKLVVGQPGTVSTPKATFARNIFETFNSLTLCDRSEQQQTLYFGADEKLDLSQFELPPAPPRGVFDARFPSGRFVESIDSKVQKDVPIVLSSASFPITISWDASKQQETYSLRIAGNETVLHGQGSLTVTAPAADIALRLASQSVSSLPKQFMLYQNYPNPFNPSTTIRFDIPRDALVTLKVYSVLGQEVAEIVEGKFYRAGSYAEQFSTASLASGVYFYRIVANATGNSSTVQQRSAESFAQTKKMLLLR